MTAGVLSRRRNSTRSSKSQVRRRTRSVSAMVSAIQRLHAAQHRVDGFIDMFEMGAEAEDRAAQIEFAVDPRAAQHHPAFFLHKLDQALVELVDIPAFREI